MPVRKKAAARVDRRYKNADDAPAIVSEKRLTFFLPEATSRELRVQSGLFQVQNAGSDNDFPESPSALIREAIEFWLDHFRDRGGQTRSLSDWEKRMKDMQSALKRIGS